LGGCGRSAPDGRSAGAGSGSTWSPRQYHHCGGPVEGVAKEIAAGVIEDVAKTNRYLADLRRSHENARLDARVIEDLRGAKPTLTCVANCEQGDQDTRGVPFLPGVYDASMSKGAVQVADAAAKAIAHGVRNRVPVDKIAMRFEGAADGEGYGRTLNLIYRGRPIRESVSVGGRRQPVEYAPGVRLANFDVAALRAITMRDLVVRDLRRIGIDSTPVSFELAAVENREVGPRYRAAKFDIVYVLGACA
jgi:hypothetical protein